MGIFDAITNYIPPVKFISESIKQGAAVVRGEQTLTQGFTNVNTATQKSTIKTGVAAAGLAAAMAAPSFGGKVAFGLATPLVSSVVAEAPKESAAVVEKTISGYENLSGNVGEFVKNPSMSSFTDIYKENPVISALLTGAGVLTLTKSVSGIAGYYAGKISGQEQQSGIGKDMIDTSNWLNSGAAAIPSMVTSSGKTIKEEKVVNSIAAATPSYPTGGTDLVSYSQKAPVSYSKKRKKAKNIKTPSINIRNYNIQGTRWA